MCVSVTVNHKTFYCSCLVIQQTAFKHVMCTHQFFWARGPQKKKRNWLNSCPTGSMCQMARTKHLANLEPKAICLATQLPFQSFAGDYYPIWLLCSRIRVHASRLQIWHALQLVIVDIEQV